MTLIVPAWTQEWQPLLKKLYTHINTNGNQIRIGTNCHVISTEDLLLRVERIAEQLYSCQYVDIVPQDVQIQTQALAVKFCFHSLEDRGNTLLTLASKCEYQVLKLLLELATSPTTATDAEVAMDQELYRTWKTGIEQEKIRELEEKVIKEKLVDDLLQIVTRDEWSEAWDDSDEDESEWDMNSNDETTVENECQTATCQLNHTRSSENMEEESIEEQKVVVATSMDFRMDNVLGKCEKKSAEQTACRLETRRKHKQDEVEEMTMEDELLCRYCPKITLQDEQDRVNDSACTLDVRLLVPFTLERPWLMCNAVAKCDEIDSRRIICEKTVVRMVFEALNGADSLLFEFHPVIPKRPMFSVNFQTKVAARRSLNVAVGHLSPTAFDHVIGEFAQGASELQLVRNLLEFIRQARGSDNHYRCVTLEGLANSLSVIMRKLTGNIRMVEQQTIGTVSEQEGPWSRAYMRQPTLLGIYGGLKDILKMVSWLKWVLIESFRALSDRQWHEVRGAEQAKSVLDSLYRMTEVEHVKGVGANANISVAGGLSRSDVLLNLFIGALNPYLVLINRMVFEIGHFETIPLDEELFFTTSASLDVDTLSTRSRYQSFRDDLLLLAPFEVDQSLVPTFLESKIDLMNRALASRQIKNCFLRQQQWSTEEILTKPEQSRSSLCELLTAELETMGCRRNGEIWSMNLVLGNGDTLRPLRQEVLEYVPFSKLLERCFTNHLETKCRELNREITDIFRDKMNYMDHVEALRMFVLMEQQDVYNVFSEKLVTHMEENPIAWADSEALNSFHQSAIQGVFENSLLSSSQRQIGGRLCVCVDFDLLDSTPCGTRIDIATMRCMYFTFSAEPPLRILFSTSIMQKYSRLGVLLVQVKAVESALIKFKSTLRHRQCYTVIEWNMRHVLLHVADMLHYTKNLLSYLTSQISRERWSKYRQILQSSRSLAEMDATHEEYLDHLLSRFFLLSKHAAVTQRILTTFNHILRYISHVDEFVSVVDRNTQASFPEYWNDNEMEQDVVKCTCSVPSVLLLGHPEFCVLRSEMARNLKQFQRQSHFLVIVLTSMQKHGASPHVNEILTQLNYNYFYHHQDHQP
ncbi:unnamed protein product [Peronospora belbahrii]|uniref:Spindle pole body component n=1 Tax=Peronospora belbahrii TaxID=622444 RepID=A0ABN8D9F7_9STRA|nr:unnamed protein product [Peronospora belbahrii]